MNRKRNSIDGLNTSRPRSRPVPPTPLAAIPLSSRSSSRRPLYPSHSHNVSVSIPAYRYNHQTKKLQVQSQNPSLATTTLDLATKAEQALQPTSGTYQPKPAALQLELTREELMQQYQSTPISAPAPSQKPRRSRHLLKRVGFGLLLILLVGGAVAGIWGNSLIQRLTGGKSNLFDALGSVVQEKKTELKKDSRGRTNLLIFGTSGYEMAGSGHDGAQLTDSIMVVSIDEATKDIAMLSLPRDFLMRPTCTATGKINELYWCANMYGKNEQAGAEALVTGVERILGLKLQYYSHINWGALRSVVDALGGITVTLDEDINDSLYTKTVIKKGVATTLNGEQALGLARARYGTEGSDFTRGKSQQKIIEALQVKVKEKQLGFSEIINLVNIMGDNLRTNISIEEIKTFYSFAKDLDRSAIRHISLYDWRQDVRLVKDTTIAGISYIIPSAGEKHYGEIQKFIQAQFNSDPSLRESVKIMILNGSGVAGAAATARLALEQRNLLVKTIGDAPSGDYPNKYYLYVVNQQMQQIKQKLEDIYQVSAHTELPANIDSTGYDFIIILGAGGE